MTHAPDLVEPVIAFRGWRLVDGALLSPYLGQRWDDGAAVARCERARHDPLRHQEGLLPFDHASPHPDCRCGIHAYFEPRSAVPAVDFRQVLGIVVVWGRVEVHPHGVRAEFARVQALGASPMWSSWHRADVAAVADQLGVPLVEERSLAAVIAEYGSSLPDVLRG